MPTILYSELQQEFAEQSEEAYAVPQFKTKKICEVILGELTDTLAYGHRAEFRGFGAFSVKSFASRSGRNPSTGEKIMVKAKCRVAFKPGMALRDRIDTIPDGE